MIDWLAVAGWLAAVLIGALVNWFFSRYYYIKAGQDLVKEARELRRLNVLLLRGLENAGLAKWSRDASGDPVGIVFEMAGGASGQFSASGDLTVEKVKPAD